ncbi:hypothetical protein H696_03877 [Fonticula alba]|uniref:TLC domain-containing protein n=1 Tax=Fonticula alba TaxID=691883 RepID=A0A058Z6A6_FONAL|nr:hypothetical protein H696_03877 [Fonticula alba]KCV69448.1 hypothetical protein H696_03877 [Fonticula alba]|eukprot:XP_009496013.1 hypothetical protein H696_03877 [Fonticula alba]
MTSPPPSSEALPVNAGDYFASSGLAPSPPLNSPEEGSESGATVSTVISASAHERVPAAAAAGLRSRPQHPPAPTPGSGSLGRPAGTGDGAPIVSSFSPRSIFPQPSVNQPRLHYIHLPTDDSWGCWLDDYAPVAAVIFIIVVLFCYNLDSLYPFAAPWVELGGYHPPSSFDSPLGQFTPRYSPVAGRDFTNILFFAAVLVAFDAAFRDAFKTIVHAFYPANPTDLASVNQMDLSPAPGSPMTPSLSSGPTGRRQINARILEDATRLFLFHAGVSIISIWNFRPLTLLMPTELLWRDWPQCNLTGVQKLFFMMQIAFHLKETTSRLLSRIAGREMARGTPPLTPARLLMKASVVVLLWIAYLSGFTRAELVLLLAFDSAAALRHARVICAVLQRPRFALVFRYAHVLAWIISRHVIYNMVLWSLWRCDVGLLTNSAPSSAGPFDSPRWLGWVGGLAPPFPLRRSPLVVLALAVGLVYELIQGLVTWQLVRGLFGRPRASGPAPAPGSPKTRRTPPMLRADTAPSPSTGGGGPRPRSPQGG